MGKEQPENKRTILKMLAWWSIPAFGGAHALHWGLLSTVDFYKSIFRGDSASTWVYVVLVQLLIAAFVGTIRLAVYYHGLYILYRSKALVDNLYADRTVIQGKYEKIVRESEELFAFGMSLHAMMQSPVVRALIVDQACSGATFRLLFHDPENPYVRQRAIEEEKHPEAILRDCETHLSQSASMIRELAQSADCRGRIQVRTVTDRMPTCYLLYQSRRPRGAQTIGQFLFVEPYLTGFAGRDCPLFALRRNDKNAAVFDKLVSIMNRTWASARPYDAGDLLTPAAALPAKRTEEE